MMNVLYVPECCSMKNSKSDSWLLQVCLAENQYPHENSQCCVEYRIVQYLVALDYIILIWKLLQFIFLTH